MSQIPERRRGQRVVVPEEARGWVEAAVETRLIDLSAMGARIAHATMLSPGCTCVLELPESLGGLALAARVVRTVEMGVAKMDAVPPTLHYESGLVFAGLSPDQRMILEDVLARFEPPRAASREWVRRSGGAGERGGNWAKDWKGPGSVPR